MFKDPRVKPTDFTKEFEFLKIAENLKKEMRHSWLSNGRQESVAEHTWRLCLMALRYGGKLDQPVDMLLCLKIALVHDLPEAIAGDVPVMEAQTPEAKLKKNQAELDAMLSIKNLLGDLNGEELFDLWMEYENQASYESKFIKALDKIEAFLQHYEAPLDTWEYAEKEMLFQDKWLVKHCAFDSFLQNFAEKLIESCCDKLKKAGDDIESIRKNAKEKMVS